MSIYGSNFGLGFGVSKQKVTPIAGIILLSIILIGLIFLLFENFEDNPLNFTFERNPIKAGNQVKIFINLTNTSEQDAHDVPLSLKAKENTDFDIYSLNEKFKGIIPTISKGTSREITFLINPIGEVLPGSYTLVAKTNLNGIDFEKEAILLVEK